MLVYLTASRGIGRTLRDVCFFRASGVKRIVGLSWRRYRRIAQDGAYESEASRLARSMSEIGDARPDDPASWDLRLSASERMRARERMRDWPGRNDFVAVSLGTKVEVNDWGVGNWRRLLARLGSRYPGLGLLLVGVTEERDLSSDAAAEWRGPVLNLCGVTSPRETAALLRQRQALPRTRQRAHALGGSGRYLLRRRLQRSQSARGVVSIWRRSSRHLPRRTVQGLRTRNLREIRKAVHHFCEC